MKYSIIVACLMFWTSAAWGQYSQFYDELSGVYSGPGSSVWNNGRS
jgi:hypothetical protein